MQAGTIRFSLQRLLVASAVGMTLFMMLQDLLTARRLGYSFYWDESLLFSSYWLLVVPVWLVAAWWVKPLNNRLTVLERAGISVVAMLAHLTLYAFILWLLSAVFMDHHYQFKRNLNYTVSTDLVKYLLIYGGLFLHLSYLRTTVIDEHRDVLPSSPVTKATGKLILAEGKTTIVVECSSILYVLAADPYIAIHALDKKHLIAKSLSGIMTELDHSFVRIHRSAIVNVQFVASWTSRGNGDYDITMTDGTQLRLSRTHVNYFREAMNTGYSA